jgi:serine/threonine-protein kinase
MSTPTSSFGPLVWPGAVIAAKYKLNAVIGEGGMGSVWSATHLGLGQPVAIKFISKDFIRSAEALRRFDAEARAAAQLRSRHVVQVFDTGTLEDGTPYIAMEILHGETLQSRVHRAGPIPLREGVEIVRQCCRALSRAHAAGIVHRDIKPDNIFLAQSSDDDGGYLVKILDFGIAKMGLNEQSAQGATRTGAVLGTPLYMSPEQARGLKTIDHRTDLYSLGLVAYTLFTGNLAFSSESFGDLLLQICTAPLPSLGAGAPWLPPAMDPWFQRACAREPQERFASAQAFSDALLAAAGVTMNSPGSLVGEFPSQALSSSPNGNVPLAASAGTSAGVSRGGDVGKSGEAPVIPGRGKGWLGVAAGAILLIGVAGAALFLFGKSARGPGQATVQSSGSVVMPSTTTSPSTSASSAPQLPPVIEAAVEAAAPASASSQSTSKDTSTAVAPPPSVRSSAARPPSAPRPSRPSSTPAQNGSPKNGSVDLGY